ncbi:MAG: YybH family protein [Gemmatimonadaceae bacterium]
MVTPGSILRRSALALVAAALVHSASVAAQARGAPPAVQDTARAQLDTAAILATARPDIDAANSAWLPGLQQRNAAMIAAAYADSGLFIAGDGTVTRGRDTVARLYAAQFPRLRTIRGGGVVHDGLTVRSPTCIVEWGHAWLEMDPAQGTGPPVRSGGQYLTVWIREADGHWRIARNLTF